MGRSIPSFRMALDAELERLHRLAEGSADPARRALLLDVLSHARALENEYAMEVGDPGEEILLSLILCLFARSRDEGRREGGHDRLDSRRPS